MNDDFNPNFGAKDLNVGQIYKVSAKTIYFNSETIMVEELNSKTPISIPFKEYSKSLDSLQKGEGMEFFALIYKGSAEGEYLGSEKKCLGVTYKQELFDHLGNNTWFDVKITKLIKGGYLALYNGTLECFIPGSHAAANIIHNFNEMLGRTITVMVDNYDKANDLFILSYKKYITNSMSVMVTELRFDKLYTGRLTNKPYDFGVFVEFENYYTGLIHKSEFENYDEIMRTLRTGDNISFYVKDVTTKGSQYRIVLTLNQDQVNSEKLGWERLRGSAENQSFEYSIDRNKNSIKININDVHNILDTNRQSI
jgi:ribosomal protein S1